MRWISPFLLFLSFLAFAAPALADEAGLLGLWETQDKDAIVQIYACDKEAYCGRFYWLKDDSADNPSLDDKNPDPDLRQRPLCGLTFLGGFKAEGEGRFEGGWLYSPRHGATFSASLKLVSPETLELRGYVFLPLLGGGQTWRRAASHAPVCSLRLSGL